MSAQDERPTEFSRFATEVKSFEKTLYGLVASSFVFAGISSLVKADHFKDEAGLASLTLLVGTIGGVAGVLVTYVGWSRHPLDEFGARMAFRAAGFSWQLGFTFLVSVASLYVFYDLSRGDHDASLLVLPISTFFFFRALVTGFLVAREAEAQRRMWDTMTVEQRKAWLAREQRERELHEEARKLHREGQELIAKVRRNARAIQANARRRKWEAIWSRAVRAIQTMHAASMNLRAALAGDALLTRSERLRRFQDKLEMERALDNLKKEIAQGIFTEIQDGTLQPLKLEGTSIEIFQSGVWRYVVIREAVDEAKARQFVDSLSRFRNPVSGKFQILQGFVEGEVEVTVQACDYLKAEGIALYRTSNWEAI